MPLFLSLKNKGKREAILLSFVFGSTLFITLCYWITWVISHYGGLNLLISTLLFLAVVAYLSLYPTIFGLSFSYLYPRKLGPLFIPFAWVTCEHLRSVLFTGFPWCPLGWSLVELPILVQIGDLGGSYLISFFVSTVNLCIFYALFGKKGGKIWPPFVVLLLILFFDLLYGFISLKGPTNYVSQMKVVLVQPNIPQEIKWEREYQKEVVSRLIQITKKGASEENLLVVWPETSLPFFFQDQTELSEMVKVTMEERHLTLLFGSPAYERLGNKVFYYNRAYLYDPSSGALSYYDKRRLVPFGEYIPIGFLTPLVERIIGDLGEFKAGKGSNVLDVNSTKTGILICYEAIFPYLSMDAKHNGAELLINITNDAWFGKSSAPYQHFGMAILRAIENRIPLIRCANTGITGVIDEKGRVIQKTKIFEESHVSTKLMIPQTKATVYNRFGYLFPYGAASAFVIYLLFTAVRERSKAKVL